MQVSSKQLAHYLVKSLERGGSASKLAKNFESYLLANHLQGLLPNIIANLVREQEALKQKRTLLIETSHEIKEKTVGQIEAFIGKLSEDLTETKVDESLIGGFRATYKGRMYDGSVKHYLETLRETLAG
jgi:F0F1-type ATP synthase delta subunit